MDDEVVRNFTFGVPFSFFGDSVTSFDVSSNGNINFVGDTEYRNKTLPTYLNVIAPLWDDHYIYAGSGQQVTLKGQQGVIAVTWDVSQFDDTRPRFQFQAAMFTADTTIGSFHFLKNDIAFSYNLVTPSFRLDGNGDSATVGLNWVDPNGAQSPRFAPLPGDADGNISSAQAGLLPTGHGDAILFRPNGNNYDVSIINAAPVPEPTSMAVLAVATAGSIGLRAWRRKRAVIS